MLQTPETVSVCAAIITVLILSNLKQPNLSFSFISFYPIEQYVLSTHILGVIFVFCVAINCLFPLRVSVCVVFTVH